jgi:hypothetical protein
MKTISGMAIASVLVIGMGISALANDRTPVVNRRQANQQARIRQGIRSGELTRGEARRLEAREGRIQADKLIDKSKGYVTPRERAQLNRELTRTSSAIYRDKHNGWVR